MRNEETDDDETQLEEILHMAYIVSFYCFSLCNKRESYDMFLVHQYLYVMKGKRIVIYLITYYNAIARMINSGTK